MDSRACNKCGEMKTLDCFHLHPQGADGHLRKCKLCVKAYYDSRKERRAEVAKIWRSKPENRAKEKARLAKAQKKNKAHHNRRTRAWRARNRDKHRAYMNEYMKQKRITDANYRIAHRMRNRILEVLNGNSKSAPTLDLLGCTFNEFRHHFESKFASGMSWEAFERGEIHIDHEIPCCAFDLSQEEEQRRCFHYTNLQPLWEKDNLAKNGNDRLLKKSRLQSTTLPESGVTHSTP